MRYKWPLTPTESIGDSPMAAINAVLRVLNLSSSEMTPLAFSRCEVWFSWCLDRSPRTFPLFRTAMPRRRWTIDRSAAISRDTASYHMTLFPWQQVWQIRTRVERSRESIKDVCSFQWKHLQSDSAGTPAPRQTAKVRKMFAYACILAKLFFFLFRHKSKFSETVKSETKQSKTASKTMVNLEILLL